MRKVSSAFGTRCMPLRCVALWFTLSALLCVDGVGREDMPESFRPMAPEVVEIFKHVPVQDGGRIKPFDTYARFKLLKFHGKRRMRLEGDAERATLSATEWLLQTLLYPERAAELPTFRVDDSDVIVAVGGTPHTERRGYYRYAELEPLRQPLYRVAQDYVAIDERQRSTQQQQIVLLAENVSEFEYLLHQFDVLREPFTLSPDAFGFALDDTQSWSASRMIRELPGLRDAIVALPSKRQQERDIAAEALTTMMHRLAFYMRTANNLHCFPPDDPNAEAWLSVGGFMNAALARQAPQALSITHLAALEAVLAARDDDAALHQAASGFADGVIGAATARDEYKRIPLEVAYYKGNFFFWSLCVYLLAFITVALSWLLPVRVTKRPAAGRWLLLYLPLLVATALLIAGITLRCIIRGRPPVSTLYETILFITAASVVVALAMEWITRARIALALAPVAGALGMFLANRYEVKEAVDTMPSLVAVLRTNFWLATHVTCITIGYAAGLLAGLFAHVFILAQLFRFRRDDRLFFFRLDQMIYGVICFGLLFAFVGTMLGGIWANYSWGRFWGWDPKENGALMIVLWFLAVLHARMGGYVRDFGTSICAIIGACIVAFSWWGVNLLGVGLHSYGFTSGIMGALVIYWAAECVVIFAALGWRMSRDSV